MRYMVSLIAGLFCFSVSAQTVINYEDGSTYTLSDGEEIYVSTENSALFKRQIMRNKDTFFAYRSLGPSAIISHKSLTTWNRVLKSGAKPMCHTKTATRLTIKHGNELAKIATADW